MSTLTRFVFPYPYMLCHVLVLYGTFSLVCSQRVYFFPAILRVVADMTCGRIIFTCIILLVLYSSRSLSSTHPWLVQWSARRENKLCQTRCGDVQWCNIRGWMQMVLTQYDLFSWNKYNINFDIIDNSITFEYIDKGPLRMLALCTLGPIVMPDSSFLPPPAPCCLLPCWELTAYLASCLALPHPLPLSRPHFPQVPGNALLLSWAQY